MGLYAKFAAIRLRWYASATGGALLRHWQWLLVGALLIPGIPVIDLLAGAAHLLARTVAPQLDWFTRLAAIAAVQALAISWILPQRRALTGGHFAAFAATLPIFRTHHRLVDLTVLAAADILPILVFGIAATDRLRADGAGPLEALALLVLLALTMAAQHFALALPPGILLHAFRAKISRRVPLKSLPPAPLPPALRIQVQALRHRAGSTALAISGAVAVALAADELMAAFHFDGRALPAAIVALALIALVLGGIHRLLRDSHAPVMPYLATLPLSRRYWPIRDTALVICIGLLPFALVLAWPALNGAVSLPQAASLIPAAAVLLALLRLPLAWNSRLSTLLGVLIAAAWAGTAIAAVA